MQSFGAWSYPLRLSFNAFNETESDEKAIAAAAATGLRKPFSLIIKLRYSGGGESENMGCKAPAATGINSTL